MIFIEERDYVCHKCTTSSYTKYLTYLQEVFFVRNCHFELLNLNLT